MDWNRTPPMIGPPRYFENSVVGRVRKLQQNTKIGVAKVFVVELGLFVVKKGSYTTFYTIKIQRIWKERVKIRKTWSMTKKRSWEFFSVKMEIFSGKNLIQKFFSAKIFCVPPNSGPGLRPCVAGLFCSTCFFQCERRSHTTGWTELKLV